MVYIWLCREALQNRILIRFHQVEESVQAELLGRASLRTDGRTRWRIQKGSTVAQMTTST